MGKMITQATKVKKVLSANAEIPVTLNSLHDDVDYSSTVSRASFEDASKDLFERLTGPIDRALQQAGMKLNDIHEVEIIGGGSRIPKVKTWLKGLLSALFHSEGDSDYSFVAPTDCLMVQAYSILA